MDFFQGMQMAQGTGVGVDRLTINKCSSKFSPAGSSPEQSRELTMRHRRFAGVITEITRWLFLLAIICGQLSFPRLAHAQTQGWGWRATAVSGVPPVIQHGPFATPLAVCNSYWPTYYQVLVEEGVAADGEVYVNEERRPFSVVFLNSDFASCYDQHYDINSQLWGPHNTSLTTYILDFRLTGTQGKNAGSGNTCACGEGSGSDDSPSDGNDPNVPIMAGDPINVSTGNAFLQQTDYAATPWLAFRRFYNNAVLNPVSYGMGMGWSNSFNRSLTLGDSPLATIYAQRPDGRQLSFSKNNGVWTSDPDVPDLLTEHDDTNGNPIGFTLWVAELRHTENYSGDGLLQSVTDESGQGITLTYSTTLTAPAIAPVPGLLLTVTDTGGRQLNFTYNSASNVLRITQPDGGILAYAYDANGNLSSITYPDNNVRTYVYGESNLTGGATFNNALTGVIDESGTRYQSIAYSSSNDSGGYATASSFAGGVDATQITYNSDGSALVQYPLGLTRTIAVSTVQGVNKVTSVSSPCGPTCNQLYQSRSYDTNGYPLSATDWNGNVTTTTYDVNGLLTQQVDAAGSTNQRTSKTGWNTALRVPVTHTVLDNNGNTVVSDAWIYNSNGQRLAHCEADPAIAAAAAYTCATTGTAPAGVRRWIYTYCTMVNSTQCPIIGLLLTVKGPRTDLTQTTTYSYYTTSSATSCGTPGSACHQAGDLYQIKDALGHVTTYAAYDGAGRVTRITDANGVNTDMTYTPRGWLATRIYGGATTTFGYDAMGDVTSIKDPSGITTSFKYDPAHRLTDILDAQSNDLHYTLDAAGNKTAEQTKTASGTVVRSLSRQFNALGQLTALIDGLNKTVFTAGYSDSYDANGNLTHTADGLGFQRQMSFDALNRLNTTIDNYNGTDTATANTETVVAQDALDRVVGVGDPNNLNTVPAYDGLSNRTKLQSPDTGTSTDTFDAAGNRLVHTDAKSVVSTSTYDALNRLLSTKYSDTTLNVAYSYGDSNSVTGCTGSKPINRLTRIIENTVTTDLCYDARGNVIQKNQVTSAQTDTTLYTYTTADRLATLTTPDKMLVTYYRNTNGFINTIKVTPSGATAAATVISATTWLPFGPLSSYTLGNGQKVTRTFDTNYRVTDITSPAFNLHLAHDLMGNVSAIGAAAGANPATETYKYDPLYRLGSVIEANGTTLESYTYNQTGDRLSKTASGLATGAYLYTTGTHQLKSIGNAAQANDANGNTTSSVIGGGTYGFAYNGRNRLSLAQLNGSTVGTYTYNALGQRIGKVTSAAERFAYDQSGQLLAEYGATNRDYIWLGSLPVAVIDNTINGSVVTSVVNYVIADQLNTPRAVTNSAGTVIWQMAYQGNAFEELQPTSSAGYVLNLRSAGEYYDAETGLNSNGFRTRGPATWRFLQSDPIGLEGGVSTYAAVGNNPLTYTDPSGLLVYITQNGNNIVLTVPIAFSGGNIDTYNNMASAISSNWTGEFGQYNVTTNVIDGSSLKGFDTNYVNVLPGNGMAQADQTGGLSQTIGSRYGTWYSQSTRGNCLDYAHEGGHLMGLPEMNGEPNLMNQYATIPEVSPFMIQQILSSPSNVYLKH